MHALIHACQHLMLFDDPSDGFQGHKQQMELS